MKVRRTAGQLLLMFAICFPLIGCGESDAQKLITESKEVSSWVSSAQLIAAAWSQGTVPTAYAQRSFANIYAALGESSTRINSLSDNRRFQLLATVQQGLTAVSQLERAANQQDRSAINQSDRQLSEARNTLNSIIQSASRIQ